MWKVLIDVAWAATMLFIAIVSAVNGNLVMCASGCIATALALVEFPPED